MTSDHRHHDVPGPGRLLSLALVLCLGLVACAVVESPPGGPEDTNPPYMVGSSPDSGSIGAGPIEVLEFSFSEKMTRTSATGWLFLYPPRTYRKTSWHGARRAEVFLDEPIPADTVVVVEIAGGMKDAHKVPNQRDRRFPLTSGGAIPSGRIEGRLTMADTALGGAVIELYPLPPDTLEYYQQPILRRTVSGVDGHFAFEWMPSPSGPFLMRAFADEDKNLRLGENEARRLLPDTLTLDGQNGVAVASLTSLYAIGTPANLLAQPFPRPDFARDLIGFGLAVAPEDSGWVPAPAPYDSASFGFLTGAGGDTLFELPSGDLRLVLFMDLDPDSSLGVVPENLIPDFGNPAKYVLADTVGDTLGSYLEPVLIIEPLTLEPGLTRILDFPDTTFALWPWEGVAEDSLDTLSAVLGDSLVASQVDSLGPALPDTTIGFEELENVDD